VLGYAAAVAIYHLSMKPLCRTQGRSAVAAAAYRAGEQLTNARDGVVHDYTGRRGIDHTEIVLPQAVAGVADWAGDRGSLWNAAELAEKRSDARTAREFILALPHELDDAQRLELTREFAQGLADRYGAAIDVALHQPHEGKDLRNRHAHLLMTTRQVLPRGFGEKTQLEWDNKRLLSQDLPTSHLQLRTIRQEWEEQTNQALGRAGHDVRVDHRSHSERGLEIEPTQHVGVHATGVVRRGGAVERRRIDPAAAQRNAARIRERPEEVLSIITGEKSVFDRHDVARALHRYIDQPQAFQTAFAKVMASPALLELQPELRDAGGATGRVVQLARYTTQAQFQIERDMAERADRMAASKGSGVAVAVQTAKTEMSLANNSRLSDEQREAVRYVCGPEQIAAVVGLAGAGKSTMLSAAREAWESGSGERRVLGAALAGKAAEGLEQSAGIPSRTLASWELSWKRGHDLLKRGDVFVIDEAGMVSSAQLARFVAAVDQAGAKLVLVGDPEQLQPINAGAAFRAIADRIGFTELEAVRRQGEDWQRQASVDFGRNRTAEGLAAYAEHGAVRFEADRDQARAAIVRDVMADRAAHPDSSRIVLAHRRVDVRALNDDVRDARREQGELTHEASFLTNDGERQFATGDRLVFLENDRKLGVKNGMLGTVERADEGVLRVRLDPAEGTGSGRLVEVDAETYRAVDHGYATTIHKSQGATVDRAFVLASDSMDRHLAYVGMTRHRTAVTLYAGKDEFRDLAALSDRLGRSNAKETTLDYERAGYAERRGLRGLVPDSEIVVRDVARASPRAAGRKQEAPAQTLPSGARPAGATRQPDSLQAKVWAAREQARPAQVQAGNEPAPGAETPQDKLRRELRGLDSLSLGWAVDAATVEDRDTGRRRPMTLADAARRVSPDYAVAADRLDELRKDIAHSEGAIETYGKQRDYAIDQGDERWRKMGTLAQYGHRIGVRSDYAMSTHERDEKAAADHLAAEEKRRDERMKMLPALERAEADALEKVRPQAEAKLVQLQERGALAHEVQQEKMLQQRDHDQARVRDRSRDWGHEGLER
jgi:Ti-type conjugative transfer relaxase TraA